MISSQNRIEPRLLLPSLTVFVWISTLSISALPLILWQEFTDQPSTWLFWAKIILLAFFIALSFGWKVAQPLRPYFVVFMALTVVEAVMNWVGTTPQWRSWMAQFGTTFGADMLNVQLLRFIPACIMIGVLLLMQYRRRDFFLVMGKLDAPAEAVKWLGIDQGLSWARLGWVLALCISVGVLVFLWIAGQPSLSTLGKALPLLPMILLFASSNAFAEEMSYRAALLAPLYPVVGKHQSMLLMAAFFGLAHFYGVPYGVIGVVMAGLLGWLLSKSMLETKGFFWPWFIHFCQDVLIFAFIAIGSVTPGG